MAGTPTSRNLFDEFEEAFQNVLAPLTKEDTLNAVNQDELRANAAASTQRFLDLARQMEALFLQKRYLLSMQKPEHVISEENKEMKSELVRKDELIKKHSEKLAEWQSLLDSMQSHLGTSPATGPRPPGSSGPGGVHPAMMGGQGGQAGHGSVSLPGLSPVAGGMGQSPGGQAQHGTGPTGMQHNMSPGMTMGQTSMMKGAGSTRGRGGWANSNRGGR